MGIIVLYYAFIGIVGTDMFEPYLTFSAWMTSNLLTPFLNQVTNIGYNIVGDGVYLTLSYGCDGTDQFIVLIAGILSFPSSTKKKLLGLLYGISIIYFLNLFRLFGLYFIAKDNFNLFETFHVVIFPIIFILISLFLWFLWMKWKIDAKIS